MIVKIFNKIIKKTKTAQTSSSAKVVQIVLICKNASQNACHSVVILKVITCLQKYVEFCRLRQA